MFCGISAVTDPEPCPANATEPRATGEANEPPASESWAVIVLPLAKLLPVTEKPMFRLVPGHRLPPNCAMASMGCAEGFTVTVVAVPGLWQPFTVTTRV